MSDYVLTAEVARVLGVSQNMSREAGREIEGPTAQVILGGLLSSTALNLFALPLLFRRFGD